MRESEKECDDGVKPHAQPQQKKGAAHSPTADRKKSTIIASRQQKADTKQHRFPPKELKHMLKKVYFHN